MAYDGVAARFTVSGSVISCLTTLAVLVYCVATRGRHRSIQHALVFNLVLAGFLNSFNNSMSGFIYVDTQQLHPGSACTANGFFAQFTSQAVDFTVLAIVLLTLLTVTGAVTLPDRCAQWELLLICCSTWAIPLIMSTAAVSLKLVEPVGWNWCWISPSRRGLQFALAQCWWLATVFFTVSTYSFTWYFVRRRGAQPLSSRQSVYGRFPADETYLRVKSSGHESISRLCRDTPSSAQRVALAKPGAKESDFSEFTLPIQGLKKTIERDLEGNGLSMHSRRHGPINSSRDVPPVSIKKALLGPNYHNQCPKVTRSFGIAVAPDAPQPPTVTSRPSISVNSTGPNYHRQWPKITRSYDVSVQSAEAGGENNPGPRYHNQCPKVPKSHDVAVNTPPSPFTASSTLPQGSTGPASPYRGEYLDPANLPILAKTHTDSSSDTVPQLVRGSWRRYRNQSQSPKAQHSFEVVTGRSQEKPLPIPGRRHHSLCRKATTAFGAPSNSSSPRYHNKSRKIARSVDGMASLPADGNRRKPTRTDSVFPSASSETPTPSSAPPLLLRPDPCANITTVTTPPLPPPSPTPGLPPPPWSPGHSSPRRRTFYLSRSTWSESISSSLRRGGVSGAGGCGNLGPRAARRALLPLAAYPLAHAVLSLPGVVQCLMEAPAPASAALLVGTRQYVGLFHAVAFALAEVWRRRVTASARAAARKAGRGRGGGKEATSGVREQLEVS